MTGRRFAALLALVVVAAGAGRVAYVLGVTRHDRGLYDAAFYELAARRLADGKGFTNPYPFVTDPKPAADHPPMTQIVLVPAAWLGDGDEAIRLGMRFTMVLVGMATVAVVGVLGRAVRDEATGLVAAGIAALSPAFWMNDGLIMSESLAALASAAILLLALGLRDRATVPRAAAAGAVVAVAMLTRAELALFLPALVLPAIAVCRSCPARDRWRAGAAAVGVATVLVAPWVGFNLARFEEPTFLSTGDGLVLRGANCDRTYRGEELGSWSVFCVLDAFRTDPRSGYKVDLDEQSVTARRLRAEGLRYLRAHVDRLPVVMAARVGRLWSVYRVDQAVGGEVEGRPGWATTAGVAFWWLTVPAALVGTLVLRRERRPVWPLWVPVMMVTALAAVFYGTARFRVPAEPGLAVLAAVAVAETARRFRTRPGPDGPVPPTGRAAPRPGAAAG